MYEDSVHASILNSFQEALVVINDEGDIVLASEHAAILFKQANLNGLPLLKFIHTSERSNAAIEFDKIIDGRGRSYHRYLMVQADGLTFMGDLNISPFHIHQGDRSSLLVTIHDLSNKVKTDDVFHQNLISLNESLKKRISFIQNLTHDINSPLSTINGFISLLGRDLEKYHLDEVGHIKQYMESIRSLNQYLMELSRDVLSFSSISESKLCINASRCNLNHILSNLFAMFDQLKHQKQKGQLNISFVPVLPEYETCFTDKIKFQQILSNLIQNALKFTSEGSISFGFHAKDGDALVFFVSDTGKGIPSNKFETIFHKYAQVDPKTSNAEGFGLGLSIAKSLVGLLGGDIWLESEENHGTVFYFSISAFQNEIVPEAPSPFFQ